MRRHAVALAGAAMLLIAVPWLVLRREPSPSPLPSPPIEGRPLRPALAGPIDAMLARDPFEPRDATVPGDDEGAAGEPDPDAPPQIVGIVGRLPDRAFVLARRPGGGTRAMAVGESVGRWRLVSIGADAALFGDGPRRVRVELPPADPQ